MRELIVADGAIEAVFLPEAGARLHRLRAFGQDLLRTPEDPEAHVREPFFWGAYVMAPWCNRIPATATEVAGRVVDVRANFADGSAIHGQVAAARWTPDDDGTACRILAGDDGWPWAYEASMEPRIRGPRLILDLSILNRSDGPMPAGLGLHPWWRRPVRVALGATSVYPSNTEPPAVPVPVSGRFDLRSARDPARRLDATWTGLAGPIELEWPEHRVAGTLAFSSSADHVAVATPEDPDATAVEIQTHAPGGVRRLQLGLPGAMRVLAPGERLELTASLTVRQR